MVSGIDGAALLESRMFGPYEVFERLGVGGMATVHRAKERGIAGFERIVALKRLLPHLSEDEAFVRAFVREARLAALLSHVNIVQIFELGRVGHHYFISMEHIDGRDVRRILQRSSKIATPPPLEVTISILAQASSALAYAHSVCDENGVPLGLVHRDISPSNLFVNVEGYVKVIDFGIANAQVDQLLTRTKGIKGKMAYLAPEATQNLDLDSRSDLFSLGVVAYELITARPLFGSSSEYQTLQRLQTMDIVLPSRINPECPAELDAVVMRALDRDRDRRWQSGADLLSALHEVAARYKLSIEPRTVRDWMSATAPDGLSPAAARLGAAAPTPWPGANSGPSFEDDGIAEMTWEGRSSIKVVLLEGVPDVSDRAVPAFASESIPLGEESTDRSGKHDGPSNRRIWPLTLGLLFVSVLVWAALISQL